MSEEKNVGVLNLQYDMSKDDPSIIRQMSLTFALIDPSSKMCYYVIASLIHGQAEKMPGYVDCLRRALEEYKSIALLTMPGSIDNLSARMAVRDVEFYLECLFEKPEEENS
jgi:hypothetical protein